MANYTYRFSPINDESTFQTVLNYVAEQALQLAQTVLQRSLPIDTLTLFAHYYDEYDFLDKYIRKLGKESDFTHGATLYIDTSLVVADQKIKLLGVRQPDPYRRHVGYADFPAADFAEIKSKPQKFVRPMQSGNGVELVELWHPDFDVLGYVVKEDR